MVILFLMVFISKPSFSWYGMPTPFLHIEGRFLKDPNGNNVVLRGGWMQPTESWFNGGGKWYSNPTDWTNPNNVAGMLNYLKDAATVMSDPSPRYGTNHGWYNTFVRVNTDAIGGWTQESGLVNQAQFNGWIQNFLVPYANHLKSRGLYLVLCATGPINTPNNGSHNAGVTEQARLRTFWSTVANAPGVKNADNIMFELMNEPVDIESSPGNGDWGHGQAKYFQAFRNWIQPVIDDVRKTGANNVVWVTTLEWQGSPQQHLQYPFTGMNCGVAVHYYPTYGNCGDNVTCHNSLWSRQYKPVADKWPMIITENFWFPEDNGLVEGSTAKYGSTLKANIDAEGNVSYMIGFLSDLLDLSNALPSNASLLSKEGAQAAFEWWYKYNGGTGCTPTSVAPYIQVNDGTWQQASTATLSSGTKIVLGPQPVSGGSWNWSGPNGYSAATREITLTNIQVSQAGDYVATYTNPAGCTSTAKFTLGVCAPATITPYSRINEGAWNQSASLNAVPGDNVAFGPQPLTEGSWQWSGPNGFTATTREILLTNVQSSHSGNYVATYTSIAGCKSTTTIVLTVSAPNNQPPSVTLTAPLNNATYIAPASITLNANANDKDGTVTSVSFYRGNTLIGSDASAPYSFTWDNVSEGSYSITARATDNNGAVSTSEAVTIIVNVVITSIEGVIGPDCGTRNSTLRYSISSSALTGATAYSWWLNGYAQNVTPLAANPSQVDIQTGAYFNDCQLCVGITYNVAPYYKTYCKQIISCYPASVLPSALIGPNPTEAEFSLTVPESVSSISILDMNGNTVYTHGKLLEGETVQYGKSLTPGLYSVNIVYASGRIEVLRIQKL